MSVPERIGDERSDSLLELVGRTLPDAGASGLHAADTARDPDGILPIPTMHHARAQLARVEQVLLTMWSSRMPDLGDGAAERLCAAHRAVHEAMLLLDDERVIADTGELPVIR